MKKVSKQKMEKEKGRKYKSLLIVLKEKISQNIHLK